MRKRIGVMLLFSIIFVFPLVSAQFFGYTDVSYYINEVITQIINIGTPVFEVIIGEYSSNEFFFSKILLLILLVIISKNILDKTPIGEDNKNISIIVSLIISILAIRFINENSFFEAIFVQYGALGIAITTILPMVIFFYFIHNIKVGPFGRKIFWGIYGIIIVAIWVSKSREIPTVANWIYALSTLAIIAFIALDKTIHSYLGLSGFRKFEKDSSKKAILEAKKELEEIKEHFRKRRMSYGDYKKEKRELEKYIIELSKD